MKKTILFALLPAMLLFSCAEGTVSTQSDNLDPSSSNGSSFTNAIDTFSMEDKIDIDSDFASQNKETFSGVTTIDVSSFLEGHVLTLETGGRYLLRGENNNARIVVNTAEDVELIFSSLNLTSLANSPVEVKAAKSLTIHLASGTKNYLSDSDNNTLEATLLVKKVPLNIVGEGYLYVSAKGLSGDGVDSGVGIQSAKGINVLSAHIYVVESNSHALNAKSGITAKNAKFDLTSKKDAFHSKEGAVSLIGCVLNSDTYGDGIDAALETTIKDSSLHVITHGEYVLYDSSLDADGTLYEDSNYVYENDEYHKISKDEMNRYRTRFYLAQKCKGFKSESSVILENSDGYFYTADDSLASDSEIQLKSGDYSFYTFDQAINSDQTLKIGVEDSSSSPSVRIFHSYEGIQGGQIDMYSSYVSIVSTDDGINAASDTLTDIYMAFHEGSKIYVNAAGDGIDSNGSILMDGGELYVIGPTSGGDSSLDFDKNFTFTGGSIFALSEQGVVQTPSANSINVCSLNLGNYAEGAKLAFLLDDYEFSTIIPKAYSRLNVIIGSVKLVSGNNLNIASINETSAQFKNGFYQGEIKSSGSVTTKISLSSGLTRYGNSKGEHGGEFVPGGPR